MGLRNIDTSAESRGRGFVSSLNELGGTPGLRSFIDQLCMTTVDGLTGLLFLLLIESLRVLPANRFFNAARGLCEPKP